MADSPVRFGSLSECTLNEALDVWNNGFAGYYSDMTRSMESLVSHLGNHHINPDLSVVAYDGDTPIGFVFVGLKMVNGEKVAWNGGTGVYPEYRGRGIGKALMQETSHRLEKHMVPTTYLEVVTKNKPAIAAYEKGGFQIVDQLIGLERKGSFSQVPFIRSDTTSYDVERRLPRDVRSLPFYRTQAAWTSQWHNITDGESHIIYDRRGTVVAYTLSRRRFDDQGQLKSITLHQCEIAPSFQQKHDAAQLALSHVYAPFDVDCVRNTDNLSMSHPAATDALKKAGFTTRYEQYLMVLQF